MNLFNNNRPIILFVYLIFISNLSSIDSRQLKTKNTLPFKLRSAEYKRFAKYCYIDDYPAWLQRQREFMIWFDLAKFLKLPVHEDIQFRRELERYRLQNECLRVVERMPISVGPG